MDSRKYDLEVLRRDWKTADRHQRKAIERAANAIRKETGAVRSMRERLIKEHREKNHGNIKDVHEYIKNKKKYGIEMNEGPRR